MENQKKITAQKKNKRHWKIGAALVAVGIVILSTTCIILFTALPNKKDTETEVVTQNKTQHPTYVKNKADLKNKIVHLQNELKKNVAQGTDKADIEERIARLQDRVKEIDAFNKWNNSLHKKELKFILKNIDASVQMGGLMGEMNKYWLELTKTMWYTSFKELTNFVLNKEKRQLLVNSDQGSFSKREQQAKREHDFYHFVKIFDQGTKVRWTGIPKAAADVEYKDLLRLVSSKFKVKKDLFRELFHKYFTVKKEHPKDTERAKRNALSTMLKHILSDRKVRESDI